MQVFLGWEDPLKEEMAICSRILAWRIPWTEETGEQQSIESQRARHNWAAEHKHNFSIQNSIWHITHNSVEWMNEWVNEWTDLTFSWLTPASLNSSTVPGTRVSILKCATCLNEILLLPLSWLLAPLPKGMSSSPASLCPSFFACISWGPVLPPLPPYPPQRACSGSDLVHPHFGLASPHGCINLKVGREKEAKWNRGIGSPQAPQSLAGWRRGRIMDWTFNLHVVFLMLENQRPTSILFSVIFPHQF